MPTLARSFAGAVVLMLLSLSAIPLGAQDAQDSTEKAGVAVGVTAGNLWFVPIKAIALTVGAMGGALSYLATGGNHELTQQIWRDTLQGPYAITPELARKSIGHRPELQEIK